MDKLFVLFFVCVALGAVTGMNLKYGTFDFSDEKIVGGATAAEGAVPYQASLRSSGNSHFCGGSIIADKWILTAAHCVSSGPPAFIVVGTNKLRSGGNTYKTKRAIPHPEYDRENIHNDIALVETEEKIVFDEKVKTIDLPEHDPPVGKMLLLTGWGRTSYPGFAANELQFINIKSIDSKECVEKLSNINDVFPGTQICTFNKAGEGACHGDSGGPLVDDKVVVGIVSWGYPCARGYPDVFTSVFHYKDWILKTME